MIQGEHEMDGGDGDDSVLAFYKSYYNISRGNRKPLLMLVMLMS